MAKRTHDYGNKRDYKKVDLYLNGNYHATTTWAKSIKEARERLATKLGVHVSAISAYYQE